MSRRKPVHLVGEVYCTCAHERHSIGLADVRGLTVYPDASGAPCVIRVDGYAFAFDCLGGVTRRLLTTTGTVAESKRALEKASAAYTTILGHAVDADWIQRNADMYADRVEVA